MIGQTICGWMVAGTGEIEVDVKGKRRMCVKREQAWRILGVKGRNIDMEELER